MQTTISDKQKNIIFWASFVALLAAGIGFGIRVMNIGTWMDEFSISGKTAGGIFGASLWPIAVGMILFSLIVDKVGYRISMILAFACQLGSSIMTQSASDPGSLINAFILAGFGHGIIEACINPLCATMYKKDKSKMLNILHASWPAGVALGAVFSLVLTGLEWRALFWFVAATAAGYGAVFLIISKYPEDERVENNVSYVEMLKEFGGLSIFLATTFLMYELGGSVFGFFGESGSITSDGTKRLLICLAVGAAAGLISGFALKSKGKTLFFILCLIMIPLATAEIATDAWIQKLMKPMLQSEYGIDSGWAIVLSSLIMMTLRFFAGVPLKYLSPPAVLLVSSCFSVAGLLLLSEVAGIMILLAFILYGIGQTFYWPTVLGFTSEQFPKGGAMTLNTVSAMGLLTVGIFGIPFLGAVGDNYDAQVAKSQQMELHKTIGLKRDAKTKKVIRGELFAKQDDFFGVKYESTNIAAITGHPSLTTDKQKELAAIMGAGNVPTKENKDTAAQGQKDLDALNAKLEEMSKKEGKPVATLLTEKDENDITYAEYKNFYMGEVASGNVPSKEAIEAAAVAKDELGKLKRPDTHNEAGLKLLSGVDKNQRKVLKWAAMLPLIMGVSFFFMILWYKSKGGYKPVELGAEEADA